MSATCTKEREVLNCPVSSMAAIKTTLKDVDSMDYLNQLARNLCQDAHRSFGAKIPGRPGSFSSEVVINPESGETDVSDRWSACRHFLNEIRLVWISRDR
jgi:hypothetical protein